MVGCFEIVVVGAPWPFYYLAAQRTWLPYEDSAGRPSPPLPPAFRRRLAPISTRMFGVEGVGWVGCQSSIILLVRCDLRHRRNRLSGVVRKFISLATTRPCGAYSENPIFTHIFNYYAVMRLF